jgi:hypothetical protein
MAKKNCRRVTFRKGSSGRKLAKPVTVTLCDRGEGKPAKRKAGRAGARAVCRAGGAGWKAKVKSNFKRGMKGARAMAPARFVKCK